MFKKSIFTLLLSLVLSTFHLTPAQANGGPIGNFNCNTGNFVSAAPDDGLLNTYFVQLAGTYTLSGGLGCAGSVTIAPGVTTIGSYAFLNAALTSVTIPNSVTTIGDSAFRANPFLTNLTIPNSVTTIGDSAFRANPFLTNLTIPNSVTTIGNSAFRANPFLTNLTIGNSVTTIGNNAFQNTGLTTVTIPNSVTTIGSDAFSDITSLATVTIGNSVTTIGAYAFYGDFSLTSVTIPNSVTTIETLAFSNTGLTTVSIPNSVTSIGSQAFGNIPAFTLSFSSETVPINTSAIGFTIANLSAPATLFSINARPPGMSFNTATGGLAGIPSTAASATAYTVTATNGIYSASTIFTLTVTGATATAPAAPTLNSATGGNKQLTIAFTPGDDGGAAITDYEYSLNGGAYTSAGTTTSPFTITSLSGRTAYSVTIKARNSVGLSTASASLSATTTDASLDASEAAAEAARVAAANAEAARVAAANAEAARKAKEQKELTEILAIIPKIAELTLGLGETTKSLYSTKCVKGKTTKYVKSGAKCPKGYVRKK